MNYTQKFLFITLLLSSGLAYGQLTEDPEDRRDQAVIRLRTQTPEGRPLPVSQRLRFGGGINGFRFGNPVQHWRLSRYCLSGDRANNCWDRRKLLLTHANKGYTNTGATVPLQTYNQYGGRAFVMYEFIPSILPNLYLHGEIENSTVDIKFDQTGQKLSDGLTSPLVGVTYSQPISRRFGVNLTALYNLNYNDNSLARTIYGSPFVLRLSFF